MVQVVEFLGDSLEVTGAIVVRVVEGLDVNLVDDALLPPVEFWWTVEEFLELVVEGEHVVEASPEDTKGKQEKPFRCDYIEYWLQLTKLNRHLKRVNIINSKLVKITKLRISLNNEI